MSTEPALVVAFKEVDGHQVHLECHLPAPEHIKDPSKPVPVVIWCHGGGASPFLTSSSSSSPTPLDFGSSPR